MASGTWQFKPDASFVPAGSDSLYIGHRSVANEQAEIVITGSKELHIKLNSLQGTSLAASSGEEYTLAQNITAFEAAYIIPLGITRLSSNQPSTWNPCTSPINDNELYIDYAFDRASDRFTVKFKQVLTPGQIVNVSRIVRAIWNGKRDNTNIVNKILKALDPTRDSLAGGTEPWPQAPINDATVDDVYGVRSISKLVEGGFVPGVGDPTAGAVGNILMHPLEPGTLVARFTPIYHNGNIETALGFWNVLRKKLQNTLGVDIANLTWIEVGETINNAAGDHYWLQMAVNDDPAKARMAFHILESTRFGVFDYQEALKNAIFRDLTD